MSDEIITIDKPLEVEALEDILENVPIATVRNEEGGQVFSVGDDEYKTTKLLGNTQTGHTRLVESRRGKEVLKMLNYRMPKGDTVEEQAKAVELFEREVEVLSDLDHPQIPKVGEKFMAEDGLGGMAMMFTQEYKNAPDLGKVIRKRRVTQKEAAKIIVSAAVPLEYCHGRAQPVIHRDVKPENILWDGEKAHLVDFGAVLDHNVGTIGGSTVIGTEGYMAPEQRYGVATEQSDVYGLGSTLLHIVTAKDPEDMFDLKATTFDKRFMIVYEEHTEGLDEGLKKVLKKSLAFKPEDRYQSVAEMREDLEDYLGGPKVIEREVERPVRDEAAIKQARRGGRWFGFFMGMGTMITAFLIGNAIPPGDSHELKEGDVAVLIDERGNVRVDEQHYNDSRHHEEKVVDYSRYGKASFDVNVKTNNDKINRSYPIEGYLEYRIADVVQVHTILGEYSYGNIKGDEAIVRRVRKKVVSYLEEMFVDVAPDDLSKVIHGADFERELQERFSRDFPSGLEYYDFKFTIGVPNEWERKEWEKEKPEVNQPEGNPDKPVESSGYDPMIRDLMNGTINV